MAWALLLVTCRERSSQPLGSLQGGGAADSRWLSVAGVEAHGFQAAQIITRMAQPETS